MNLASIYALFLFGTAIHVAYDIYFYEFRQDRWEKRHPGKTYIRNYRKLTKMGLIDA